MSRPKGRRQTLHLSDQWMDFADQDFDADEYVEGFFLTHPESEAEDRCNELMNMRYQTQDLLRQKVSSHYQLFMRGTEDIQHVEQDIALLRRLLVRMQESLKQLDGASAAILAGGAESSSSTPPGSRRAVAVSFDGGARPPARSSAASMAESLLSRAVPSTSNLSGLPKWVAALPEDLERLMIEKQRPAAVALVDKARAYFSKEGSSSSIAMSPQGQEVLSIVNRKADLIAERLIRDVDEMSRTILYDFTDISRQLRMLIILGKAETAVEFFIRNRGGLIERAPRLLEAGGDTLSYVTLLSERFFALLTEACGAFDALFAAQSPSSGGTKKDAATPTTTITTRPDCFARLVLWVDAEVRRFGTLVGRQLVMTRRDLLGNKHLQKEPDPYEPSLATAASRLASPSPLPPSSPRASIYATPQDYLSSSRSAMLVRMSSMPASPRQRGKSQQPSGGGIVCDESFITIGACLEVCFSLAARLDRAGLPVRPSLASVLSRDLGALLSGLAHSASLSVDEELWSETWTPEAVEAQDLLVQPPSSLRDAPGAADHGAPSSSSPAGAASGPSSPSGRRRTVKVLSTAVVMIREVNSFVASFLMLKEPPGAKAHYAHELTLVDQLVLEEVLGIIKEYPGKLEKRWAPPAGGKKKRLSPQDLKERAAAAETLQVLLEESLDGLSEWILDPLLLVDMQESDRRVRELKAFYKEAIAGLLAQQKEEGKQPGAGTAGAPN